jgi:hypothetical protein
LLSLRKLALCVMAASMASVTPLREASEGDVERPLGARALKGGCRERRG